VEKFYNAAKWMTYLIDMFLKPGTMLASELANPVPGRHYPEEQIRSLATQQPSRVGLVASILAVRAGIVGGSLAGPKLAALSPFGLGDCPMCS
jgi:hypothetical protein